MFTCVCMSAGGRACGSKCVDCQPRAHISYHGLVNTYLDETNPWTIHRMEYPRGTTGLSCSTKAVDAGNVWGQEHARTRLWSLFFNFLPHM